MYPHDLSCIAWDGEGRPVCVCDHPRPYRIRKMSLAATEPWFVWRRTGRGPYELRHRAASFAGAAAIVALMSIRDRLPSLDELRARGRPR